MKDDGGYSVTDYYLFTLTFLVGFVIGMIVSKDFL